MSRSRKKTNITGITTCDSEKQDKRIANRRLRRVNKIEVSTGKEVLTIQREGSNVWDFGKDGKQVVTDPIYLRK